MLKLLMVELLKIRRSLSLLMMILIPMMVVVLNVLVLVKRDGIGAIDAKQWGFYWMTTTAMWCYFMLPLYIALVTGLLNGQEHKNQSWRLMLTLPVSQTKLFLVKGLLAWLFVMGASAILAVGGMAGAGVLVVMGASAQGAFDFAPLPMLAKLAIGSLPVIAIQHAVSWRYQNLVLPLGLGVVATMGITQIGSSRSWMYYPWSYNLMAVNGADIARQQHALILAALTGAALFAVAAFVLGRREVEQ